MRSFNRFTDALRFEALLAGSVLRSRECLASKVMLLLGLGYEFGPWPLAPDRLRVLGYLDELLVALVAIAFARLLIPAEFEVRVAERYGFCREGSARRSLRFARVRAAILAQWLLAYRRLRLSGCRLRSALSRFGSCLRSASRRRGVADRLFGLLGYRVWWRIRAPFARRRCDDASIVVIGGSPRSGTTLLRTMLGRHPLIAAGPETTVFLRRITAPAELGRRLGWDPDEIEHWQRESRSQVEFIERFRAAVRRHSGKPFWAEKTPHNVFRFGFVRRHFPRAKLVHIVRDGRDVVCSLRRTAFAKLDHAPPGGTAAAYRCGVQWRNGTQAGLRFRGDPAYYELRYEDLVRDPEPVLRRLLDFLGLPWDAAVLQPDVMNGPVEDEMSAAGELFGSSVRRWRHDLSTADQRALATLIGPLLVELGYSPDLSWGFVETRPEALPEERAKVLSDS